MSIELWSYQNGIVARDDCAMFPAGELHPGVVAAVLEHLNLLEQELATTNAALAAAEVGMKEAMTFVRYVAGLGHDPSWRMGHPHVVAMALLKRLDPAIAALSNPAVGGKE